MEVLTTTEAQKEENIADPEQITRGIQAAKEQGLGEWTVKVAGRSFDRLCELATNPHNRKTVILDNSANIRIHYQ